MKTLKTNKELQANALKIVDVGEVRDRNARGKKHSWIKAKFKKATRHIRQLYKKIKFED